MWKSYICFYFLQGNLQIHQVHVGQDGQVNVSTLYHHSLSMWVFLLPFSLSSCFSSFDLRLWCLGQRALPVSHLCSVRSERNFRSKAAHPNTFSNSSFCIHVYVTPWLTTWFCMACVLRWESDRCLRSVCLALLSLALNHTFYFNSDPATNREITAFFVPHFVRPAVNTSLSLWIISCVVHVWGVYIVGSKIWVCYWKCFFLPDMTYTWKFHLQ